MKMNTQNLKKLPSQPVDRTSHIIFTLLLFLIDEVHSSDGTTQNAQKHLRLSNQNQLRQGYILSILLLNSFHSYTIKYLNKNV